MANDSLEELQKAAQELRNGLKNVDQDIKKLTGRDPSEMQRPGGNRRIQLKRNVFQRGNRQEEPLIKQRRESDGSGPRRWGRTVQLGSRVSIDGERGLDSSGEEDESSKPAIQSVITSDMKPVRLQSKPVDEDRQTKSRNRRMFGLLVGTLQQFKEDTKQKTAGEKKRQEIEKKLEQKAEEEKQEVSSQRKELFQTRKQKQQELKTLERKMENALLKEEIAAHNKEMGNFILLKAKPSVFYLPAKHNDTTKKLLEESKTTLCELHDTRCRDIDLDAEDFGFNSSFNTRVNNGKKQMGRAVEVNDVSHRDLFEEDRMEDENEREEIEKNEANEEKRVGDCLDEEVEMRGEEVEMRGEEVEMKDEGLSQVNEERRALIDREELVRAQQRVIDEERHKQSADASVIVQGGESLNGSRVIEPVRKESGEGNPLMNVSEDVKDFVANNLGSLEVGNLNVSTSNPMDHEQNDKRLGFEPVSEDVNGLGKDSIQGKPDGFQYQAKDVINANVVAPQNTFDAFTEY